VRKRAKDNDSLPSSYYPSRNRKKIYFKNKKKERKVEGTLGDWDGESKRRRTT
jgi:hypothetical protein